MTTEDKVRETLMNFDDLPNQKELIRQVSGFTATVLQYGQFNKQNVEGVLFLWWGDKQFNSLVTVVTDFIQNEIDNQ